MKRVHCNPLRMHLAVGTYIASAMPVGTAAAALLLLQLAITCAAAAAVPKQLDAVTTVHDGAGEQISWQGVRRQMLAAIPQVRMKAGVCAAAAHVMSCT
jgi:uncharacterized membrane protein